MNIYDETRHIVESLGSSYMDAEEPRKKLSKAIYDTICEAEWIDETGLGMDDDYYKGIRDIIGILKEKLDCKEN